MQCILTALKAESQPLIDHFKLKRDSSFSFPIFRNDTFYLIALGVGKKKIRHRIVTLYETIQSNNIQFINVGIAGGNRDSTQIGNCYFLNKIEDESTGKSYYPDSLIQHNIEEKSLVTVEKVVSNGDVSYIGLVDMEASEIFKVCSSIVPIHRLAFLKIVSDHMDIEFEEILAQPISKLILNQITLIEKFLIQFNNLAKEESPILSKNDMEWILKTKQKISLTETQHHQLLQKAKGFRLRKTDELFPEIDLKLPINKTAQKLYFKYLCEKLSA